MVRAGFLAGFLCLMVFSCSRKSCPPENIDLQSISLGKVPYKGYDSLVFIKSTDTTRDTFHFKSQLPGSITVLDYKNESSCRVEIRKEVKEYKFYHPGSSLMMRLSLAAGIPDDSLHIYFASKHFSISAKDIGESDTANVFIHNNSKDSSVAKYLTSKGIVGFRLKNPTETWQRIY